MDRIEKRMAASLIKADATADIGLINQYSLKVLKPEDVFCFSVILCDNDVDRDFERFTNATLDKLAPLFVGKTGILDHNWTANNQISRAYRVEAVNSGETNSLGEARRILRADAYILRTENTAETIEKIEGGILKEVSVGAGISSVTCSICGEKISWMGCKNGHQKGRIYDEKLCFAEFNEPTDAYEWSFVAVPAQRGAGVTKGAGEIEAALDLLFESDLSMHGSKAARLIPHLQFALTEADEREKRAKIMSDNEKFIKTKGNEKL